MERNDFNYRSSNEYRRQHDDNSYNDQNRNESLGNYRDRYSNRRGNYYGMHNEDAAYRNVRVSNPDENYGYRSGGPVAGYDASSYRGATQNRNQQNQDHYHYGDPNPYMGNRRSGGYEANRGTGWEDRDEYGTTGTARSTNYSAGSQDSDRYRRQDNSYQYGGAGRRYEDFGRDEHEKSYRGRSDHGYNMLGTDAYYDRGDHPRSRSQNDYDRRNQGEQRFYEGRSDQDDYSHNSSIRNPRHRNEDDYSQRSSRYRRPGESSGPDYRADSRISGYSDESTRG